MGDMIIIPSGSSILSPSGKAGVSSLPAPAWTPDQLTSLEAWYDADDATTITESSGSVSQWDDKSGNAGHATQSSGTLQPTLVAAELNGLDVLRFDGSNDTLDLDSSLDLIRNVGDVSVFYVSKISASAADLTYHSVFACTTSDVAKARLLAGTYGKDYTLAGRRLDSDGFSPHTNHVDRSGDWVICEADFGYSAATRDLYIDAENVLADTAVQGTGNTSDTDSTYANIGSLNVNNYWYGDIAEIAVVIGGITETERDKMEGYLAHKWGLEANLPGGHPYKSSAP